MRLLLRFLTAVLVCAPLVGCESEGETEEGGTATAIDESDRSLENGPVENGPIENGPVENGSVENGSPGPSWGVVTECTTAATAGLGGWDGYLLLHGDSSQDIALAEFVSRYYQGLELRAWSDFSDEDRSRDLFIVGSPSAVPLLREMNGSLTVWFDESGFLFGGYRYDQPGHGIAMIQPSPLAAGKWLRLHVGNSYAGAFSTFTIPTGSQDFNTTRGRSVMQQQGALCRSGTPWGFLAERTEDRRAEWEQWVEGLEMVESSHHRFHYLPGSVAASDMNWLPDWQEEQYQLVLDTLELSGLEFKIDAYLYPDNETKGLVTGDSGNAHSNTLNYEVHGVYNRTLTTMGPHEDTHVVTWHLLGETNYAILGEGIAVMMSGEWWGEPLASVVSSHRSAGTLPTLRTLIDNWAMVPETTTYPVAGHFVQYLLETYGVDAFKRLYTVLNLDQSFESELGITTAALETSWLATIE